MLGVDQTSASSTHNQQKINVLEEMLRNINKLGRPNSSLNGAQPPPQSTNLMKNTQPHIPLEQHYLQIEHRLEEQLQ